MASAPPQEIELIQCRPPPAYNQSLMEKDFRFEKNSSHPGSSPKWLLRIGFLGLMFGLAIMGPAFLCHYQTPYCPHLTACWSSVLFVFTGIAAIVTARHPVTNFFVICLVLSLLTLVAASATFGLSLRNYKAIGVRETKEKDGVVCILNSRDVTDKDRTKLKQIWNMKHDDVDSCVSGIKTGIAYNVVAILLAIFEGIFGFLSSAICCYQIHKQTRNFNRN